MIQLDRRILCFKRKDVWFAEGPYDVKGYALAVFHFCSKPSTLAGFQIFEANTLGIDLNRDLDEIWGQLNKTTRYEISKAQEYGFKIKINQGYHEFMELNRRFRERRGLHRFQVPINEMKANGILFLAYYNDIIQGGQFYLQDDKNIRLVLSVSRRLEVEKDQNKYIGYGNKLLVWEAICHSKKTGKVFFDLGGFDPELKGINQFKEGFSRDVFKSYKYTKTYSKTYTMARNFYNMLRRKKT